MTIMLMAFVCVGITACGGDGDSNGGNGGSTSLVGKWMRVYKHEIHWQLNSAGEWELTSQQEKTYTEGTGFLFNSDNTAKLLDFEADGSYTFETDASFNYKVENGHLYLLEINASDTDGWEDWGEITFSGEQFQLSREEIYGNGQYKESEVRRYRKV